MKSQVQSVVDRQNAGDLLKSLSATISSHQIIQNICNVGIMSEKPTIDGSLDDHKWRFATGVDGLISSGITDSRKTRVYIGATVDSLYFAFKTEVPPWGDMDPDDKLGVLIGSHSQPNCHYRLEVNPDGSINSYKQFLKNGTVEISEKWLPDWNIVCRIENGFWLCEIEAPVQSLERNSVVGDWQLNVFRKYHNPEVLVSLTSNGDLTPFSFAFENLSFQFMQRMLYKKDPGMGDIDTVLNISNPSQKPIQISAAVGLQCAKRQPIIKSEKIEIAAGATYEFFLMVEGVASREFSVYALVCDGYDEIIYTKHNRYSRERPNWIEPIKSPPICDFRFAYYPSYNKLRLESIRGQLPVNAIFEGMHFCVKELDSNLIINELKMVASEFKDGVCEKLIDLPPLEGLYEIIAQPLGTGVPTTARTQQFERKKFEWEGLGLGTSRKVYPPFTPIKVIDDSLFTVMKEYQISPCGLFNQVITEDQARLSKESILAAPIQYKATINGVDFSPENAAFSIEDSADDTVLASSKFVMGDLEMSSELMLDFDGMFKVELKIPPSPNNKIERLDIEIPLKSDCATLIHATSVRYRDVVLSEPLPNKQGLIWSACQMPLGGWVENFCTYLFVGNASRGLSWFVDNDHGWSWNPQTPNIEIIRKGDITTICIHLINQPTVIKDEQMITFGLQAAPVKPRMAGWRHRWYSDQYSLLGCDPHWFALGSCSSVYPVGKGFFLWEILKRCSQEKLSQTQRDQLYQKIEKYLQPFSEQYGQAFIDRILMFARNNLRARYGKKLVYYYNRASYRGAEEFQTFTDEWGLSDYNQGHRGVDDRLEQLILPTESWIDHSLFWYTKSFEIGGNQGVYMDNTFLIPITNRQTSGAYKREDGTISPSTSLWALRSMAKRTFQYLNEYGIEPLHMSHLTSLQILPVNSFYTVQYDWEWEREMGPVHTRFSREYLLLVTNGEHAGTWPIVLHETGRLEKDPWILKTFLGVTIIHDILIDPYYFGSRPVEDSDVEDTALFKTFRQPILDFVKNSDVDVYRYWDARTQPVKATHPDLPTIVFVQPGIATIVAITSYAAKDESVEMKIDPMALGFEPNAYKIIDIETGIELSHHNNIVNFDLIQYDLKEFKIQKIK